MNSIELTPLEKTAVHTPTQKEYDALMQVYELGGWTWHNAEDPTSKTSRGNENYWSRFTKKMCVGAGISERNGEHGRFQYGHIEYYVSIDYKIISTQEFYEKQNISKKTLKEVGQHFGSIDEKVK